MIRFRMVSWGNANLVAEKPTAEQGKNSRIGWTQRETGRKQHRVGGQRRRIFAQRLDDFGLAENGVQRLSGGQVSGYHNPSVPSPRELGTILDSQNTGPLTCVGSEARIARRSMFDISTLSRSCCLCRRLTSTRLLLAIPFPRFFDPCLHFLASTKPALVSWIRAMGPSAWFACRGSWSLTTRNAVAAKPLLPTIKQYPSLQLYFTHLRSLLNWVLASPTPATSPTTTTSNTYRGYVQPTSHSASRRIPGQATNF